MRGSETKNLRGFWQLKTCFLGFLLTQNRFLPTQNRKPPSTGDVKPSKLKKADFIENIDFRKFFFRKFGFVPVRKNKKAAFRRKIQFLVPSSDEDRGLTDQDRVPNFPNQRISYTSSRESFSAFVISEKSEIPNFRFCYL